MSQQIIQKLNSTVIGVGCGIAWWCLLYPKMSLKYTDQRYNLLYTHIILGGLGGFFLSNKLCL